MICLRDNRGITLVELMVSIVVASIVTLAAVTVLLLGLRIYTASNQVAIHQNQVRLGITVMETLVAEAEITTISSTETEVTVNAKEGAVLQYHKERGTIITDSSSVVLEGVEAFSVDKDGNRLTFNLTAYGENYTFTVLCREAEQETEGDPVLYSYHSNTPEAVLMAATQDKALTPHVRAFLKSLASQLGSTGRILTPEGEGDYYSAWYIGGFGTDSDWNAETPWCACYLSWAMHECRGYLNGRTPRFANVDEFLDDFIREGRWKTQAPQAGDIVFFDWIVDEEDNPQHVGVVLGESHGRLYTIEGNSNGTVALCQYAVADPRILGYGMLDWTA